MKITKLETRLIQWLERHLLLLIFLFITLASLVLRFCLRDVLTADAEECLIPWYDLIAQRGGLLGLDTQVGNYNLCYQFFIALMTYLPIPPLYAYKIFSCIFDYALAVLGGVITAELMPERKKSMGLLAYSAILLLPTVWLNSAAWAQCDAIYTFFLLLAFWGVCRDRIGPGLFSLGLALAFKLQAVFAVPFFLLVWFMKRQFSILNFGWVPAALAASGLPAILMGRNPLHLLTVYFYQTQTYEGLFWSYPTVWLLLSEDSSSGLYRIMAPVAILITMAVLIFWAAVALVRKVSLKPENLLKLFFLLNYTCVLFLPAMHERYGFTYEIAALLLALLDRRTLPWMLALEGVAICSYGAYLFGSSMLSFPVLALINCGVYVLYSRHIFRTLETQ